MKKMVPIFRSCIRHLKTGWPRGIVTLGLEPALSTLGWPTFAGPRAGRSCLRVCRRWGLRRLVCNATLSDEHSRCSRGVGLERKISMTFQGNCATYFSI
jgi:hypothetical protein